MENEMSGKITEIYVILLEEGTSTMRPTEAEDLGDGLFRLLPTPDYDPEDEVWEFEPQTIVYGQDSVTSDGERILKAIRLPLRRDDMIKEYSGYKICQIYVLDSNNNPILTDAIDLGNGFFKLLPTENYDPLHDHWEFTPGSIVIAKEETNAFGKNTRVAFEQIREDRMSGDYARFIMKSN
jgi:hypothetical protein